VRGFRAEWLLVPLLILPLGVAGAFVYGAYSQYGSELEAAREDGSRYVYAFLDDGGGPGGPGSEHRTGFVRRLDVLSLLIVEAGVYEVWKIEGPPLPGPSAAALADPRTRARLEGGESPVSVEPALTADGQFAALYRTPDLAALRNALLSARAKLFLLGRLPPGAVPPRTRRLLRLAAELQERGFPSAVGYYRFASGLVFLQLDGEATLWTDSQPRGFDRRKAGPYFEVVFGPAPAPDALWSRRDETPFAGCWSVRALFGPDWWHVPRYRRWIQPMAVGSLAYLCIPIALLLALRRRRQLDAARVRFLTEVAHDLRTPLTAVRLHAELLASSQDDPVRRRRYIGVLERETARASVLLANLLDVSRLESGRRRFALETVDVQSTLTNAAEEFRQIHPDRADDLELRGDVGVRARADVSALARCVGNLLDNAGKYTQAGTRIRLRWESNDEWVQIEVADGGEGVPLNQADRVFERYARGSNSDTVAGTGLGLSLVRELAEGMGGSVSYENQGSGACFVMRLRRDKDA